MAEKKATLEVHLQPGAKNDAIVGLRDGVLWAKVKAPPLRGQANRALLELMAQTLMVSKNTLSLVRGHTSRHKVVAAYGLDPTELKQRLAKALSGASRAKKTQGRKTRSVRTEH